MADNLHERRSEPRSIIDRYYSVEFSLSGCSFVYQFKIWNISTKGICVLVKEGSDLLNYVKVGDVVKLRYYPTDASRPSELLKTEIKHITRDEPALQIETYVAIAAELESSEEVLAQLKHFITERADFVIITTMGGKSSIPHFDEVLELLLDSRSGGIRFHVEEITSPGALSEVSVPKQRRIPQPDVISCFLQ